MVCKNSTRPLILGLNFNQKFRIRMDWNTNGRLFLHMNGHIITHTIKLSQTPSKLKSIQYQEIPTYTTAIIQVELQETPAMNQGNQNHIIKFN